ETAKTSLSGVLSAASMAFRVAGLPALIGVVTPGKSTKSRNGSTGKVRRSVIYLSLTPRERWLVRHSPGAGTGNWRSCHRVERSGGDSNFLPFLVLLAQTGALSRSRR